MAKNIKQMALEYANENYKEIYALNIEEDLNKEARAVSKESFEAGANAVLEEIEKCLDNPSMIQGYSDILAKVQELKGE